MIFWLCLVITIGLVVLTVITNDYFGLNLLFAIASVFMGIAVVAMLICIITNSTCSEGTKEALDEQYKSLIYKTQCEEIRDEFGILNKEYVDEVQDWNIDVAAKRKYCRNFWIGIFYPNYLEDYKTIDLDSIIKKEK